MPAMRPPAYDCPLKETALKFATSMVINGSSSHPNYQNWAHLIYDALELAACGVPPPPAAVDRSRGATTQWDDKVDQVFVAPPSAGGDDQHGTGSRLSPFATVQRALVAVQPGGTISLASGVYPQTRAPITLNAGAHDGITIEPASPTDTPVITGAVQLTGLTWETSPVAAGAVMAKLPVGALDASQVTDGAGLTLTVEGVIYTLARWPNANPLFNRFPDGYSPEAVEQLPSTIPSPSKMQLTVESPSDIMSNFPNYVNTMTDPLKWHQGQGKGGVVFAPGNFSPRALSWSNPNTAVISHWDGSEKSSRNPNVGPYFDQWMNYFYKVSSVHSVTGEQARDPGAGPCPEAWWPANSTRAVTAGDLYICFGRGGWQGLNGDSAATHRGAYVFNVREELDQAGEWYLEADGSAIHIFPNATAGQPASFFSAQTTIAVAQSDIVLRVQGTADYPVRNVTIRGITFTGTRPTVMDLYERPSTNLAGWSVRRAGALFIEGAEFPTVDSCSFIFTGGNSVVLSNYVRGASIRNCEFSLTGDSGIVSIGTLHGVDGTPRSFVDSTTVRGCLFHDLGWLGKQISGYTQFATARAQLSQNTMFNLPRSGWNLDDGFAGGTVIDTSLGFAAVRESADHGVINSWAREPQAFVHPSTGEVTIQPDLILVVRSLFIAAGGTLSNIDPDDGSFRQLHDRVVSAYAGRKNYLGREKTDSNSLYLFPDLGVMSTQCYFSDGNVVHAGWDEVYANNTCILFSGQYITDQGSCDEHNVTGTVTFAKGNRYYLNTSTLAIGGAKWCCGTCPDDLDAPADVESPPLFNLSSWQAFGEEAGSTVTYGLPTPAEVVTMAKDVLGMQ